MNEQGNGSSPEEVIEEAQDKYQQLQQDLKELDVLMRQSSAEVEKLAHRNAQLTNKVRNMEANFDTVPRDDIKATYKAAQEVQVRLFMMRGQVEQLTSKQSNLQDHAASLRRFLDAAGGIISAVEAMPDPDDDPTPQQTDVGVVKVINAQESERRTLANQLHDGPAQALTNLILQAEICERLFDSDPSRAKTELTKLKDAVSSTFQKVREFIFELRPMMLDELGLTPTLRKTFEDFEERYNITCNFRLTGDDSRLPAHAEVTIFRVVQQLIKNVQQHASGSHIQITLDVSGNRATTVVEDDGTGFEATNILQEARERKTMGLGMSGERIEMLGGEMHVDSSASQGTRVEFWIPTA